MRRLLAPLLGLALAAPAMAQTPSSPDAIEWTTFVGGPGRPSRREVVSAEPGAIELGDSPWRCGYARPRHAAIGEGDWSVQRVLACRRGEATVTSTASCRVRDGRVEEHAATLSLGTAGVDGHVTVTLGCQAATR
ncbi:MAG: hypothetical protein VYE22_20120 [Myxococcota bacterium]|nr:hypothetical protein [Myxococcota bacterium]